MIGGKKRYWAILLAAGAAASAAAKPAGAAEGSLSGGSGYSADLSGNPTIRRQQLIVDPADPLTSRAPIHGSTSVLYDPAVVSLTALSPAPGYSVSASVAVEEQHHGKPVVLLQPIKFFLAHPGGPQAGYLQIYYHRTSTPGELVPPSGFTVLDSSGVNGFDTNALTFNYLHGVPNSAVADYEVFASRGNLFGHNPQDFLTAVGPNGKHFTLGPSQLSPAFVSGSLSAVPLPPTLWGVAAMLAGLVGLGFLRRRTVV